MSSTLSGLAKHVFELLCRQGKKGMTSPEIAAELDVVQRRICDILNILCSIGLVDKTGKQYSLRSSAQTAVAPADTTGGKQSIAEITVTTAAALKEAGSSSFLQIADKVVEQAEGRTVEQQKNIRRRCYDCLHVLHGVGALTIDATVVSWVGLDTLPALDSSAFPAGAPANGAVDANVDAKAESQSTQERGESSGEPASSLGTVRDVPLPQPPRPRPVLGNARYGKPQGAVFPPEFKHRIKGMGNFGATTRCLASGVAKNSVWTLDHLIEKTKLQGKLDAEKRSEDSKRGIEDASGSAPVARIAQSADPRKQQLAQEARLKLTAVQEYEKKEVDIADSRGTVVCRAKQMDLDMALLEACESSQSKAFAAAQLLLEHKASQAMAAGDMQIPLLRACANSRPDIVELLLQHGLDLKGLDRPPSGSPLFYACRGNGDLSLVKLLLARGIVTDSDRSSVTALEKHQRVNALDRNSFFRAAIGSCNPELVKVLLHFFMPQKCSIITSDYANNRFVNPGVSDPWYCPLIPSSLLPSVATRHRQVMDLLLRWKFEYANQCLLALVCGSVPRKSQKVKVAEDTKDNQLRENGEEKMSGSSETQQCAAYRSFFNDWAFERHLVAEILSFSRKSAVVDAFLRSRIVGMGPDGKAHVFVPDKRSMRF